MAGQRVDLKLKLHMIGDSAAGKTCLMLRYAKDTFSETFVSTIGIDFTLKETRWNGKRIQTQIWDTAGQERFRTLTSSYFRGADGILLVYDVTNRSTFLNIRNWMAQIDIQAKGNVIKVLVGNKCDLQDQRVISYEEGEALAREYGVRFFETSAKESTNVEDTFRTITQDVLLRKESGVDGNENNSRSTSLASSAEPHQSSCC